MPAELWTRPRIGLTLMCDSPIRDTHLPRYGMNTTYFAAVRRAGGVPVPLAPGDAAEMELYVGGGPLALDGILLAGGGDIDPAYYHQEMHPKSDPPEVERDEMEMKLLELIRASEVPILALCRGIQVLNVAYGGTLIQDIGAQRPEAAQHSFSKTHPRNYLAHAISIDRESRLAQILKTTNTQVNSLHHQAVDHVGEGLIATAWAPDGIIEALELADQAAARYLIAMQCHPEDLQEHEPMRWLFDSFIVAAREFGHAQEA